MSHVQRTRKQVPWQGRRGLRTQDALLSPGLGCRPELGMRRWPEQGHLGWEVEIMVTHRLLPQGWDWARVPRGQELPGRGPPESWWATLTL